MNEMSAGTDRCRFCQYADCDVCKGPKRCECHELVNGHGQLSPEEQAKDQAREEAAARLTAQLTRNPTMQEAEAILTLVRSGWLRLELTEQS